MQFKTSTDNDSTVTDVEMTDSNKIGTELQDNKAHKTICAEEP